MGSLCCNAHQIDVIVAVCAYTVLILGTWRVDAVVKPFKLLAVFVHEGCHACACLATGGRVDGVEVNINEGGVTRYRGGWRLCVTPAGYLGGAFWAAICTAVLDYRWGMFAVAASLGLALLSRARLGSRVARHLDGILGGRRLLPRAARRWPPRAVRGN